uniref:Uncharacterized protein n=1 Tax=Klebsiella pneumoniae TaxID=573 RepID=A0A8B0SVK3_KLEPN|nr:hypothetical protein [Klebsiella pneumoniae]
MLSYLICYLKSLKSKKRLQHKYDEVFKAFSYCEFRVHRRPKRSLQKNLSLSNAQLQFLAVYLNQDTVQFDGRNIVCEKKRMMFSIFFHLYQTAIFLVGQIHERNK